MTCLARYIAALGLALAMAFAPMAQAAQHWPSHTSRGGTVTVKMTPLSVLGPEPWRFKVKMTTHSIVLDYDLTAAAVLVDEDGQEHAAVLWQGDPPQSRRRSGILQFQPLQPYPSVIIVKLRDVGGVPLRTFSWPVPPGTVVR